MLKQSERGSKAPISLMANVLLDELDHELEARGHSFARYADDFVILCTSPRAGRRILENVRRFLQKRLKLIVNEAKSQVVKLSEAAFLGFQILVSTRPSPSGKISAERLRRAMVAGWLNDSVRSSAPRCWRDLSAGRAVRRRSAGSTG